jgi:hypothetical protein
LRNRKSAGHLTQPSQYFQQCHRRVHDALAGGHVVIDLEFDVRITDSADGE